jgi:hypothetical protein
VFPHLKRTLTVHRFSLLSFVLLGGLACSGNPAAPHDPTGTGQLAMLNALVVGDPATLNVDGNPMTLPPAGQSGTAQLSAGAHQLQVLSGGQVLTSASITLTDGGHRTAVLSGAAGHNVLLVTTLDTASVPVLDAGKMRLVHTVAGAPAMDAYLFAVGQADDSAARFVTPFAYGTGTDPEFPGYAIRPPGQYLVWLKAAGTDTVLLQAGPFTVHAGDVYSFVLAQNAAGEMELRVVKEH